MKQFTETFHVDVPPEKLFDAVTDPESQSGRAMKVEVVTETPEGVGTTLRYFYQVLGMRLRGGTYSYSEYVPGRRFTWDFSNGGVAMALTGGPASATWTFEPADGGTDVTVQSEFETRIPGLNHIARGIMMWFWRRRDLPRYMAEVEKKAKVGAEA